MDFSQRMDAMARFSNAPYMQFLKRSGIEIDAVSAEDAIITDAAGRQYIDCIAGYGNCVLGHNPRTVIDAVVAELQSSRPFNLPFVHEVQARLAEKLALETPGDLECSFIVNSGSEAVETALKLARLVTGKAGVVCATGAWHGFTFGCLSVSEQSMCRPFRPLLEGITHVPFGDVRAVEEAIDDRTGCVIVEPIQSESGAIVPPQGYLKLLRELCARKNILLIFDEVKTGVAKTGRMFACEHDGAVPDIMACGKALGGGVMPIGAVVARRNVWGRFGLSFPMSSSSGAGNAPACAAALATLELVRAEGLCERAECQGARLMTGLKSIQKGFPERLLEISGRGLLIGLKFVDQKFASRMVVECVKRLVLVMNAFCDRSKILVEPSVCITDEQADRVAAAIGESLSACAEG